MENKSISSINSQYVIESNTMIFYDRSITDAISARKFHKCIDVFTANVTAKIIHSQTDIKDFRVISLIFDERQLSEIDLRSNINYVGIDFYLLGFIVNNGVGNSILEVVKPYPGEDIELFVKGMKADFSTLTNMTNDNQHVMNDQIVFKKDNVGTVPFRRISVFHSEIYAKHPDNNTIYKLLDIYRPSELDRSFTTPPDGSQANWFVTGMPVNSTKDKSNGKLIYIKNPHILTV